MIREFKQSDLQDVLSIWLESNLQSHPFIPASYWTDNLQFMTDVLPQSEVYVYELDMEIIAFVGLQGNYIAGLFVRQDFRSKGIGHELIACLQNTHDDLTLCVYEKNKRAVKFYRENGFRIKSEKREDVNNENEYVMHWAAELT